jgi:hypothetical protein
MVNEIDMIPPFELLLFIHPRATLFLALKPLDYTTETKKAPGVPGLQVVSNKGEAPRGNEPLDAPILSEGTNQARRESHKGLTRRWGHPSTGQAWGVVARHPGLEVVVPCFWPG